MANRRYCANCSMLFTERPLLDRPAAAAAAGFDAIEFWWPWPLEPVPSASDVDAFVAAVEASGVRLAGLNLYAGNLAGADCGVLSLPERNGEFQASLPVAVEIGRRLGVEAFNALYGVRTGVATPEQQDALGVANLAAAAQAVAAIGATLLVEPISGPKPYPLRTAADVVGVLERVAALGVGNVGLLFDLYHLAANGDDLAEAIDRYADRVAHVQIADHPGRGEPGSGTLPLDDHLDALADAGYTGLVALEYKPTTDTLTSLGWLPSAQRGSTL